MKKGVLVVVALLAIASVMAAMAYTSAQVRNDMNLKLVDTTEALLALTAGNHEAAYYKGYGADNYTQVLAIDLSRGLNGEEFGVQPFSTYIWNELFNVKNNSENAVMVKIRTEPDQQGRAWVRMKGDQNWVVLSGIHNGGGVLEFKLEPGEDMWIDTKTDALNGWEQEYAWTLIVEADAIPAS
ncbi:MAG: hypothetical protein ACOX2S_08005 [bacterium]